MSELSTQQQIKVAALNAAVAHFAHFKAKSVEVLDLAEKFETWVIEGLKT